MADIDKFIIPITATVLDALAKLDKQSSQATLTLFVLDAEHRLVGTITDGDCRRGMLRGVALDSPIDKIMNPHFTSLTLGVQDPGKQRSIKEKGLKLVPVLDSQGRIASVLNFKTHKAYLPVDAVLMAGGKGERLRPLTLTTPKPLLEVGGRPIIEYNIDNLTTHGIENINITINYLREQFEAYFAQPREGVRINCVGEQKYLGTIGSVKLIDKWHNDTVLVMNSDLFTNIDLESFFLHFKQHDADMSIAAVPYSVNIPYGIFDIQDEVKITGIREKPNFSYYANAGIYLIKREILDLVPRDTFFNATDLMELMIERSMNVTRFPLSGYWIDIGKPEDFRRAQDFATHTKR